MKVVQEFNKGELEIKTMEEKLQEKTAELTGYRDNIAQVHHLSETALLSFHKAACFGLVNSCVLTLCATG